MASFNAKLKNRGLPPKNDADLAADMLDLLSASDQPLPPSPSARTAADKPPIGTPRRAAAPPGAQRAPPPLEDATNRVPEAALRSGAGKGAKKGAPLYTFSGMSDMDDPSSSDDDAPTPHRTDDPAAVAPQTLAPAEHCPPAEPAAEAAAQAALPETPCPQTLGSQSW